MYGVFKFRGKKIKIVIYPSNPFSLCHPFPPTKISADDHVS